MRTAELFDPATKQFSALPPFGLIPRAHHTATLLTDGTVFVAGGVDDNSQTLGSAQLWDPRKGSATGVAQPLFAPRKDFTASLQSDGTVLLWGGTNASGTVLTFGEIYNPVSEAFRIVTSPSAVEGTFGVAATIPDSGSEGVSLIPLIGIRLSSPGLMQSASTNTAMLADPNGTVAANVIAAESGMLIFVSPQRSLAPGTSYTLTLNGVTAANGSVISDFSFTFATEGQSNPPPSETVALPTSVNWSGGPQNSPFLTLPPLLAPNGVTAISGQVLLQSGLPLTGVTLRVGVNSTLTDATGRFLLTGVQPGHSVLIMDGRSANTANVTYGVFEAGEDVSPRQTHVLGYTVWMPIIDTAHAVTIPVPTTSETVITSPAIPGLEFHLPAGATVTDIDGKTVNQISITPIPVSQPPFPLPQGGAAVPLDFTIQPGGGRITVNNPKGPRGGWVVYPNILHKGRGSRFQFLNYDPEGKGWHVSGSGSVTANASSMVPDSGVTFNTLTGTSVVCAPIPFDGPSCCGAGDGDPVDLGTGLFVYSKTDLYVPDVIPIDITRVYRQGDPTSEDFGVGSRHPYDIFVGSSQSNTCAYYDLYLPDFTRIHYTRYSAGTDCGATGPAPIFGCDSCPGEWFGSTLTLNTQSSPTTWVLYRRDGMTFTFPTSSSTGINSIQTLGLLSISDANGNGLGVSRNQNGYISQITTTNGRYVQFSYDSSNRITQIQDSFGRTVQYAYDSNSCLTQVTDANGGVWKYGYTTGFNGPCYTTTITDPRNITYVTNQYDSQARVIKQTHADGGTYTYNYVTDPLGNITETDVTDPLGNVRKVSFNSPTIYTDGYSTGGTVASDIFASGSAVQQTVTNQYQPGTNLLSSTTDTLGRATTYSYDSAGNEISATRLSGTPNAVTTTYAYQVSFSPYPQTMTRLASITDPLGHTTQFTYDIHGNMISRTDPLGNTTSLSYDSEGRVVSSTDALGKTTKMTYDGAELSQVTDPLGRTTTFSTGPFGTSGGRFESAIDPLGHQTQYEYDALFHMTGIVDSLGSVTLMAYDSDGNLNSVTDANQHTTQYTYDSMDRLSTRKDALQNSEAYQYDGDGNLTQFTDRRGKITSYGYDGLNRRVFIGFGTQPGPTYESTINYTYDSADRLTQAADSLSGMVVEGYDGLDRLVSETTPQGSITYTYDAADRRQSMTIAGQAPVNYVFDAGDRLTGVTQGASTVSFTYDATDRRTSLTLPNSVITSYSYDADSELLGITYAVGLNTLGNLGYAYDSTGRHATTIGSFAQTNLPLPVSNAAYNADNQLTQWGTATPTYDTDGNMLTDGTNTFVWSARNSLISMNMGAAAFTYDAFDRRVSKTTITGTMSYLYDDISPVQEIAGGTVSANMLSGGTDEYFTRTDSSGTVNFLTDALGSTVALTDNTGSIVAAYGYEPFGATTATGNSSNPYQFTGRENDGTGLYYFRSRYYEPALGRFISEDPLGFGGGADFYAYVGDDPLDAVDPLGLFSIHDGIEQHGLSDIDAACGPYLPGLRPPAGACSKVIANVSCQCDCTKSGWKANVHISLLGNIFFYNGDKWPYKNRIPNSDTSVINAASAIAHEYSEHINPAAKDTEREARKLESKTFKSKDKCDKACEKADKSLPNHFQLSLLEGQREEGMKQP